MKKGSRTSQRPTLLAFAVLCCLPCLPLSAQDGRGGAEGAPAGRPKIVASDILDDLLRRQKERPEASPQQLADYANSLLEQKGFNYSFDACAILEAAGKPPQREEGPLATLETYPYELTDVDGRALAFDIVTGEGGGLCSECFFKIPVLRATEAEILLLAEGRRYRLRRPKEFRLDDALLIDEATQDILRTWQLPFQTVPSAISPDGSKLYVEFYEGRAPDTLILELSDDGSLRFRPRADIDLTHEVEWLTDHPTDPADDYLSFIRLRAAGNTYTLKFSAPCT